MDWNLNQNSWNLTGFKAEAIQNLDSFDSRSAGFADHRISGDFSIDLKLGRVGHSHDEEAINLWKQQSAGPVSKMESSSSSSSPSVSVKRARAAINGVQVAYFCLVDGCNADLSNCKDYHKRHKVCEFHSKSPQVTIAGQKQRFCQQCSRFHSLEEFDEGKRSCRKRLDGHNRRRRKPQPDFRSHPPSFLSNYKGTQFLPFSNSQVHPSTTVVTPTWPGIVNPEQGVPEQSIFFGSPLNKAGKQFPFLQIHSVSPATSVGQPLARPLAFSSKSNSGGNYHALNDKLTTTTTATQVHDSDCALSLLSSTQTQTFGNHMRQPNSIPLVQHIDQMDSVLVSNGRDPWSSSGNKAPQTLPFNWE